MNLIKKMKRKRSKRSRIRGRRSCGSGARNNYRGKGTRGGKGMAGTGKRAGQKLTWVLKYAPNYFGKRGFSSLKRLEQKKQEINLDEIREKLQQFLEKGIAKKTTEGIELDLKGYKILSRGSLEGIKEKLIVKADAFSEKAKEKLERAGGSIVII